MSIKRRILIFFTCLALLSVYSVYADDDVYNVTPSSEQTDVAQEEQPDTPAEEFPEEDEEIPSEEPEEELPAEDEENILETPEEVSTEDENQEASASSENTEEPGEISTEDSELDIEEEEVPLGMLEDVSNFVNENIVQPVISSVIYSQPSPEPETTPEPSHEPEEEVIYGYELVAIEDNAVPEAAAPNEHSDSMLSFVLFFACAAIMIGYVFDSSSLQKKIYAAEDRLAAEKRHHNKKP